MGALTIRFAGVDSPQGHFEGVLRGVSVRRKVLQCVVVGRTRRRRDGNGELSYGCKSFGCERQRPFLARRGDQVGVGAERLRALESDLRTMAPADAFRPDAAAWFNG
ncbi:hypothetical protein ABZS81_03700 [Streptomyces sp. NPDC005318]|uniref:hypothetical protein n=1 Tax=Streptomyces sp. NPDC005318 TaxID=3157031 RepID=UPI0033B16763